MEISTSTASLIPTTNMNTIYRDFNDFLIKHSIKKDQGNTTAKKPITNTRIGDQKSNIYGGSYHIPESEYSTFLHLYNRDILVPKKKEYLTETQLENDGPILIDIDLRHDYDVDERQYSKEHIDDLLDSYLGELNKIYQPDENTNIPIFVFEKPTVNRINTEKEKKTKDGIHIIIGLKTDRITQIILRTKMIKNTSEMWSDLPITNTWEDVFDDGITKGHVNWQLYGSRKPNHDRYQLTRVFEVTYDESDGEFMRKELPISSFDIGKNIEKLSVRYKGHQSLFMRNNFIKEYEEFKHINQIRGNGSGISNCNTNVRLQQLDNLMDDTNYISKISNAEDLQLVLNHFLDSVNNIKEYELRDAYEYVNILPPSYYEAGSYHNWIRVQWVLRNTDNKLLIVWIAFCAKASNFDYRSIPELCEKWRKTDLRKHNGLSKLSLMRWAKIENKEAFEKIRNSTIDFFVEETINKPLTKGREREGCGDWDLANLLYQLYKHEFVCVSVKSNIWYQYKDNRWVEIDSGTTLRKAISIQLRDLYNKKSIALMENMTKEGDICDEQQTKLNEDTTKSRNVRILNICQRLSSTNDKKNIMTEARELFYDGTFLSKLDTNPYLLCFKNGVVDFKEKIFRKGQPEDNISMTTNIDYIPINPSIHQNIIDEFNDFMSKIFPEPELCRYMYDHLAAALIGTSANQTFNMYIGGGRNGKSVLVNLMEIILGQYSGIVPLTLVTEKRGKVGGLTPEIVELKGKRYAVMQEPQKGEKMNEGIMKQLTSGKDQLQGRAPYMTQTISFTPQFKLVVCCNNLLEIKSNDYGTWRRIRAVPFKSLFSPNPFQDDKYKDIPYQFKEDENIGEKFEEWKEVVAALFVQRVFETNGVVKDCDIVLARSNEYRQSQDYISEFVRDCVIRASDGRIKKMELNNEFSTWYASNHGGRGPPTKDLHEYMDKEFGRNQNSMWSGVKIKYVRDEIENDIHDDDHDDDDDDIDTNRL